MPEKFNFNQLDMSKEDDQKKYDQEFEKLPKDEQVEIVGEAQEEAEKMNLAISNLTEFLSLGKIDEAIKIKDEFNIPKEILLSPKIEELARERFKKSMQKIEYYRAKKIKNEFYLPEEFVKDYAQRYFVAYLAIGGDGDIPQEIHENFPLSDKFFKSKKTQKAIKEGFIRNLSGSGMRGGVDSSADYFQKAFLGKELSKELIFSAEIQKAAEEGFANYFKKNEIDSAMELKKKYLLPDNIFLNEIPNFPNGTTAKYIVETYEIPQIGKNVVSSLHELRNFSLEKNIKPIMSAQGDASYLYFESTKRIVNYENLSVKDIDYITFVGKKYGTQARNILENILSKVGAGNIGQEKEIIEEYLSEIGIAHFDIYSQYKKAKIENNPEELEKMKEKISKIKDGIYKGEIEEKDFKDNLYPAISYHTFPPAMGLTQDQYNRLNKTRPDRMGDVPESLDDLQYQKAEVSTGKYNLGEGEELDLKEWTALGKAIKKVNAEFEKEGKVNINESEIAEKLIEMYKKKSSEKGEDQEYLFESMYRYHLAHDGGKLESGFEISIEGLMQYKEFIGDRIKNDLIKDCLAKWREKHEKEFEELKNDTMNRLRNSQSQNFAKVSNMMRAIEKQKDEKKKEKIIDNLDEFLKNFGMSYEMIKDRSIEEIKTDLESVVVEYEGELTEDNYQTDEYYNSEAFLSAFDEFVSKHDSDQLVYQKIGSDLVAGINKKMRKEVDKFKFEDQAGSAEKRELEFIISKKKEHGVAGFNMGVCVAPDEKLWNDPQFLNCIMFDPKLKQAMGGMHFLIRENNLCLPGINPSLDVLGQVKNEELFDRMMEYAKKVKEKMGLEKILIPESSSIHSNRTQIQEIIRKKAFKKYKLQKEAEFSYSPYKYSFQECFEV